MKPNYNSINALENLMTIIDKEGTMQVTVKEVLKACQFIEAILKKEIILQQSK